MHDEPGPGHVLHADSVTVRYGRAATGARDVSFTVRAGEILGTVGESGSGKSTMARAPVGPNPFTGTTRAEGADGMGRAYRRAVQIVFQDPDASLNPRQTIGAILARPLVLYGTPDAMPRRDAIAALLTDVQLQPDMATRYPHRLSGRQKQRVATADRGAASAGLLRHGCQPPAAPRRHGRDRLRLRRTLQHNAERTRGHRRLHRCGPDQHADDARYL